MRKSGLPALILILSLVVINGYTKTGAPPTIEQPSPTLVLAEELPPISEPTPTAAPTPIPTPEPIRGTAVLAFGGDVNLMDGSYVMPVYRLSANGLPGVISGGLLDEMRAADVLLLNVEFAFTGRGTAIPGKQYVFRASPKNVGILGEMGLDVAFLANNHVFDYGADGLADTLQTLDDAEIPRIGAGMNIEETSKPASLSINGWNIAYVGAGCIERYSVFTPGASEDSPGIFRTDEKNAERFLSVIREASETHDFVIANLHWGIESTTTLEDYQRELGQMCIDAGADAVIGSHPHVLQGAEFYNGKPIIYSTGNFWFSTSYNYTCLLELLIDENGDMDVKFVPCITGGGVTRMVVGDEAAVVLEHYERISFGVTIDGNGRISSAD